MILEVLPKVLSGREALIAAHKRTRVTPISGQAKVGKPGEFIAIINGGCGCCRDLTGIIWAQVLKYLHPGNNLWDFYGKSGFNSVDPQSHGAVRAADFYRST